MLDGATLDNQTAATLADSYSGYGLYLYDGAVFDNEAGPASPSSPTAQISGDGSGSVFQNDGALIQSADATGSSGISAIFDQSATGTTEVMGGGIYFQAGGAITNSMTADAGAYLQFNGGTFDLDAASTLTGAGTAYFTGATVDDAGAYTITGTTVLSNGTLDFSGGQSVSIPDLTMSGGTLTGFTSLAVTGPTDWTGGAITGGGTITTQGALTLGDPGQEDQEVLDGAPPWITKPPPRSPTPTPATACTSTTAPSSTTRPAPASPSSPTRRSPATAAGRPSGTTARSCSRPMPPAARASLRSSTSRPPARPR